MPVVCCELQPSEQLHLHHAFPYARLKQLAAEFLNAYQIGKVCLPQAWVQQRFGTAGTLVRVRHPYLDRHNPERVEATVGSELRTLKPAIW